MDYECLKVKTKQKTTSAFQAFYLSLFFRLVFVVFASGYTRDYLQDSWLRTHLSNPTCERVLYMLLASSAEERTDDSTIQMIITSLRNLPKASIKTREREQHIGGKKRWPGWRWFTCLLTDLTVNKKLKLRGREKKSLRGK
jgi:hypothetical protein